MTDTNTIGVDELRQILVDEMGVDESTLLDAPGVALGDLGFDSIALVELGVVLRDRFGVEELPEEAGDMTLAQLAKHLAGANTEPLAVAAVANTAPEVNSAE
ncbi:MAG TPA: acyl carrier protein [Pseudonocardiaceae bacterium]